MKKFATIAVSCLSISALLLTSFPSNEAQAYFGLYPNTTGTTHESGQAKFNTDAEDKPTLRVANHTQNPNMWFSSISGVRVDDIVSFDFYYHNTSDVNAPDTRAAINFSNISAANTTGFSATGKIWAANASPVSGSTNVYLAEAVNGLSLSYQSAFWYPNQSTSAQSLPSGQSGAEVISAQGVSLGTIASGWTSQGHLVVRFKVTGTPVSTTSFTNDAQCVSIDAPNTVTAGQTFTATVVVNNSGTKTWNSDATPHRLGSQNSQDNLRWGLSRVNLAQSSVAPGQNATFTFTATAPAAAGTYLFDWKMVEENTEWFGATCTKTIAVNAVQQNDPDFTLSVSPGGTQTVTSPYQLSYTVYVDPVNGSGNPVSLSFISSVAGISGVLNQTSVWPGGYTTLTISVSSNAPLGTYTSVVRGVMGNKTHDANITLAINDASQSQPTLTISPSNINTGIGGSVQFAAFYDPDGIGYQSSQNVTGYAVWNSYQSQIARAENTDGLFTGLSAGSATVAASYAGLTATAVIGVNNNSNGGGGNKPIVMTKDATIIAKYSGLLGGAVNPSGSDTVVWFEYGTTPALGEEGPVQAVGSGTGELPMAYALLTLNPDTTYYFRAGAENIYGVSYGQILNFRTLKSLAPVVIAPAPQPIVTVVQVAENPLACVDASAELDRPELLANQEFNYVLHIQNNCSANLSKLSIVITLPEEVSFVSTSYPFRKNNGTITYNLGVLEKDTEATILIQAKTGSVKKGETITFFSRANFLYQGKNYSVSSPFSVVIGSKSFFSANVLDFAGNILDYLLIVLIVVGVMFAWNFFKNKKKS